jgi:predicted nucleic acid-binding protein
MKPYVLDTFALLSFFQGEASGVTVRTLFEQALDSQAALGLSLMSAGELFYITCRKRGANCADEVWADLQQLPVSIYPVTEARVLAAAQIKARYTVSYADAFSIALAQELDATVVTRDPEFKQVESLINIMWL